MIYEFLSEICCTNSCRRKRLRKNVLLQLFSAVTVLQEITALLLQDCLQACGYVLQIIC